MGGWLAHFGRRGQNTLVFYGVDVFLSAMLYTMYSLLKDPKIEQHWQQCQARVGFGQSRSEK